MSRLKIAIILLLLPSLSACEDQVVEFALDAGTDAGAEVAPVVTSTLPRHGDIEVGLNTSLNATFSEAMDPLTITTATMTLQHGATPVAGTVTYAGVTATFVPGEELASSTVYTATISTGAKDLNGLALVEDHTWSFTTGEGPDVIAPTVTATVPVDQAIDVAISQTINATFSEAMDASTITSVTMRLMLGLEPVAGNVNLTGMTATFLPENELEPNTVYTVSITTEVADMAGNTMFDEYTWSFTTNDMPEVVLPTVISTIPGNDNVGVPLDQAINAVFSRPMDPTTINDITMTVLEGANPIMGIVTYLGLTATFAPVSDLLPNTFYTATITLGAEDLDGNTMIEAYEWSFATGDAPDIEAPQVILTYPVDLEIEVPVQTVINATFSEEMKQSTMITTNFFVEETESGDEVLGSVSYDVQNRQAIFTPRNELLPDTEYTVTVSEDATDLAGNALVVPAENGLPVPNPWSFRTAPLVIVPPPLAINLRGIETFGIAAREGLTSTGITVVNGDVALYPLASCIDSTGNAGASQGCLVKTYSSPTGMTVNGSIYWAGDPFDNGGTANSVTNDLNIAWTEGQNKADTRGAIPGDQLGGGVFLPGVYHNAALGLQAGTFATMDGQGDDNAIFIFKVDSSFVDSGTLLLPTRIDLVNGAQARNVWFVAGLDITIGSGTIWNGNILAGRSATVLDGSTVTGRVLAGASGAGAITLTGAASPSVTTISVPE